MARTKSSRRMNGNGVANGLGELRLSRSNVASKHDQGRPTQDGGQKERTLSMVRRVPALEPGRVDQQAE